MQTARKRSNVCRIRRRKAARRFFRAYGFYILTTALALAALSIIVAAVAHPAQDKETRDGSGKTAAFQPGTETIQILQQGPTEEAQPETIPYPFNLMSHDWGGEDIEGWTAYKIPAEYEKAGGELPECMQQFIYIICKQNGVDYALVLAMIEAESGYKWDASSPEGSQGYMQVNVKWHEDRMERLGVYDVLNPYFNIMVGVDFLKELQGRFETEAEVLTAYNYGVAGAYKNVWDRGLTKTEYSRNVQQIKRRIEEQLGGGKNDVR